MLALLHQKHFELRQMLALLRSKHFELGEMLALLHRKHFEPEHTVTCIKMLISVCNCDANHYF